MVINLVADLILALLVAFCTYMGMKKGLLTTVVNIILYIASFILATLIYKPIHKFISGMFFVADVNSTINKKISEFLNGNIADAPDFIEKHLENGAQNVSESLSNTLTSAFVFLICAVIIFVIIKLLFKLFHSTADLAKNNCVIGSVDKFLGTVLGFVNGIIIVCAVLFLCALLLTGDSYETFSKTVSNSYLTNFFYNNNFLMNLVVKYL